MTPADLKREADEEIEAFKNVFEGSWILDQSYLANGTALYKGICPCLNKADLIVVKREGSFWICKECLYGT
jgi:hypothetical protein